MKRFILLFAVAVLAFVGCNNAFEDEHYARLEQNVLPTLTAGFEDATRTYVEQNTYLRWHADDRLTIFYGNTLNRQYKFNGKTGDNSGSFSHIPSGDIETGNSFDHIYAVYPYDANIDLEDINKSLSLTLPAVQEYAEESFGKGANTMVAVTKNTSDTFLGFKNACGYLKIKLYGDGTIKSIELKGNNGEKIAGKAIITAAYGDTPQLTMAANATGNITLDCGSGVMLSSDAENPTEFWFVVPPTEFSKGITVTATDSYGSIFEQSTSNKVVVERNEIQPMSAIETIFRDPTKPANNEIWYTSCYSRVVEPYNTNAFGVNIISNIYQDGKGIITFDGDVTTIGEKAFYWCESLTSVIMPDSVTSIGEYAFRSCYLYSITMSDNLTSIGEEAFGWCDDLRSLTIPDSVTTIENSAFEGCRQLTNIIIPDSVITIGTETFCWCDSLISITIGDSVTSIGDSAFYNCTRLEEFKGKFAADNGRCLIIDGVLNSFANGCGATEYTIPDSVTTIGNSAFWACDSLTSVTIGDSVTTIGVEAFAYCNSLTSVTIPDSVTLIGEEAFYSCDSLTSVTIPDSVTTIGFQAFWNCDSLTSVTIPDSVTTIGDSAFSSCSSLTSVTIPNSVTTIGESAFSSCDSLTSVTIGDSVTAIGNYAFYNCYRLKSVTIPNSVTTIGDSAFCGCDSLTEFKGKFASEDGRCLIIDGVLNSFANGCGATEYTIPDSVTTIGDSAFWACDSLTSVTIGDSVTTIGESAFSSCDSLTSVTIPDSVTAIGNYAFYNCYRLKSVTIGDSVTTIGEEAFYSCTSLTSVYSKPTTPPSMGYYVFYSTNNIQVIYVPTGSVEAYRAANYWKNYADKIEGYDF